MAQRIERGSALYPAHLDRYLGSAAPAAIWAEGNVSILSQRMLGLFCSVKCPGSIILETYELARTLRDAGVTVVGGFHTPMEQECLALLLRGSQPVVVCPARGLGRMRLPAEWKQPLAERRLLILSPFPEEERRITAALAQARNDFVAALAADILVTYAAKGGRTEAFAREALAWGKPVLTVASPENEPLVVSGARPVSAADWRRPASPVML